MAVNAIVYTINNPIDLLVSLIKPIPGIVLWIIELAIIVLIVTGIMALWGWLKQAYKESKNN